MPRPCAQCLRKAENGKLKVENLAGGYGGEAPVEGVAANEVGAYGSGTAFTETRLETRLTSFFA